MSLFEQLPLLEFGTDATISVVTHITTQSQLVVAEKNGNHDSGYAPSNVDDVLAAGIVEVSSLPDESGTGRVALTMAKSVPKTASATESPTIIVDKGTTSSSSVLRYYPNT